MSTFRLYFELGVSHIMNLTAYDHLLFILALCARYLLGQWRQVLILITAFTIGHSLTLALATLNILQVSSRLIEFLIPLTIFITSFENIFTYKTNTFSWRNFKYGAALFFGLIHGLGFSYFLRSLLGKEDNILKPLFAFNLGIETGQCIIVTGILLLTWGVVTFLRLPQKTWRIALSFAGMSISFMLMVERFPW